VKNLTAKKLTDTNSLAMLLFTVGEQEYGLPVTRVVRIIEMVTIVQIHGVSEVIQGIINFHGRAVPVMDMRHRLGFPIEPYKHHTPIIMVDVPQTKQTNNDQLLGLIVDEVSQVVTVFRDNIKQTTAKLPEELTQLINQNAAYLEGIININRKMVIILNINSLLSIADYAHELGITN